MIIIRNVNTTNILKEVTEAPGNDSSDQLVSRPHPHTDLYTRNLTLINITNFKFLINNDICDVTPVAIVTIVHTAAKNKKARDIIRSDSLLID